MHYPVTVKLSEVDVKSKLNEFNNISLKNSYAN